MLATTLNTTWIWSLLTASVQLAPMPEVPAEGTALVRTTDAGLVELIDLRLATDTLVLVINGTPSVTEAAGCYVIAGTIITPSGQRNVQWIANVRASTDVNGRELLHVTAATSSGPHLAVELWTLRTTPEAIYHAFCGSDD
ncbi:MAG TPA: hypothetical protein VHL57_04160 [Flavobacteriales bacterium]|jgi:hypothetical protein|nr:hypothetical protein [Flavobacteriales bacterium]